MNTKEILNNNNFIFKKKYGQNFLLDNNILNNIVSLADIDKDSLVIEIGVGAAALTKFIAKKAGKVLGYEIDTKLKEPLHEILKDYDNVEIIFDDFLKRDLKRDLTKFKYNRLVVVANLPYYITTPIITSFIEQKINVEQIIVMVQNEVADRFSAKINTKNYNSLTIFLNYYFSIKKAFVVSRNVFFPKPNVDSAIVIFSKRKEKIKINNEEIFFKLVKDAFKQKRKTLKNNLKNYPLEIINNILSKYNKNIMYRAENIDINEFADIANNITKL